MWVNIYNGLKKANFKFGLIAVLILAISTILVASPHKGKAQTDWQVQIEVTTPGPTDTYNFFGIDANASNCKDGLDIAEPPTGMEYIQLYFDLPGGCTFGEPLTKDIRAPFSESSTSKTWNGAVNTNQPSGTDVNLSWKSSEVSGIPGDYTVKLTDQHKSQTVNMRDTTSYNYTTQEDKESRSFTVVVKEKPKELDSLEVSGPSTVDGSKGNTANYTATAHFTDGSNQDVTADATWSEDFDHASISAGTLEVTETIYSDEPGKVEASYTYNGTTKTKDTSVTIKGQTNEPPKARDDPFTVGAGSQGAKLNVLQNDSDPEGSPITLDKIVSGPSHGNATIEGDKITYTPDAGYEGSDSLVYEISDERGATSQAAVEITVSQTNVTKEGDTWIIETQPGFNKLVGNKLSDVDFVGDSAPDIEPGDTIALSSSSFTQRASITVDLQNITIRPTDDVLNSDRVSTFVQKPSSPYGKPKKHKIDTGPNSTTTVTASIIITKEGTHLKNINFEPSGSLSKPIDNAILVDVEDPCACQTRDMLFENLQIPTCGANGNFNYGIRFTGNITTYGAYDTDYSSVDFYDVRIDGVEADGINFAHSVGGVSDLHFDKLYVGNCGSVETSEHGIFFNNHGKVENVRLEKSTGLGNEPTQNYGIEKNQDGIRVNGDHVTKLAGFRIEDFQIKNNTDNGIYILGNWNMPSEISAIDMTVKDAEISENGDALGTGEYGGDFDGGFGILVGELGVEGEEPPEVSEIYYSPAKLDKVTLDNVEVFNNKSGGAGFFVSTVISNSPGFEVKDSRFNEDITGNGYNDQAFGLTVASYEGIKELGIDNSTFHDHDGGLGDVSISGLQAPQSLSDGIALLAAYEDGAHDDVENVTIQNTSANDNDGNGLRVAGKIVDNLNIKKVGKFNENGTNGIHILGDEGVRNVTIEDKDTDDLREITADGNGNIGLFVESNTGDIKGLDVTSARFGKEGSINRDSGVKLLSNGPDSSIGADNSSGALQFKDVSASYNMAHGLEIDSAEDFLNPSSNVVVNNSEFHDNHEDGVHLEAEGDVMNPRFENSSFVGNDVGTYGLYLEFGKDLLGTGSVDEIKGNVFAGNTEGLTVTSPDPSNPAGSINNFSIMDNTTFYAGNEEEYNGNEVSNIALIAGQLNSVDVKKNILVGEKTEVGLFLQAADSSSAITVNKNIFRTGAEGACIGLGTAVVLDAWNADINHNEFNGFSTAVEVLEEKAISPSDGPDATSNHINNNNIIGCCTTINAEALRVKSEDTGDLHKVDATDNYWGANVETPEDVAENMVAPKYIFFDDFSVTPFEIKEILNIESFKVTTSDPQVGKTVDIKYTLKNVSDSKISGQSVRLIVKDPNGNVIIDTPKEDVPELEAGKTYTNTHSFLPTEKGDYSATLEVDEGAVTDTIPKIDVSREPGPGPQPDNYTPNWAKTGIMPAPVDGSSTPKLEITNEEGNAIKDADVSKVTINVFDLSGKKLLTFEDSITGLSAINDLENGLYLYSVQLTTDDGDFQSPVKKFVVKK